jgi:hypothetical protein
MRKSLVVTKRQMAVVEKSIASMVPLIGPEIYSLPLNIEHNLKNAPAYTNKDGIWIRRDVAQRDGKNVCVYIMHEIFHHVIKNPELMGELNHQLVNLADDYHINYLILKLFGKDYDVRKVKFPGVYNARLGKMHPFACAQAIIKRDRKRKENIGKEPIYTGMCGCSGVAHSSMRNMALDIRKKYNIHLKDLQGPLIVFDKMDERKYNEVADTLRYHVHLPRIQTDLPNLVQNLFMKAFLDNPTSVPGVSGKLGAQQMLTYCWDTSKFRNMTEFNEEEAALAVASFLAKCAMHPNLLRLKLLSIDENLRKARGKKNSLSNKLAKKNRNPMRSKKYRKLVKLIPKLEASFDKWKKKRPLYELLVTDPVFTASKSSFKTVTIGTKFTRAKGAATPQIVAIKSNETSKAIRWVSNLSATAFVRLSNLRKNIEKSMGPLLGPDPKQEEEQEEQEEQEEHRRRRTERPDSKKVHPVMKKIREPRTSRKQVKTMVARVVLHPTVHRLTRKTVRTRVQQVNRVGSRKQVRVKVSHNKPR